MIIFPCVRLLREEDEYKHPPFKYLLLWYSGGPNISDSSNWKQDFEIKLDDDILIIINKLRLIARKFVALFQLFIC